jgi:hypothetical protein
MLTRRGMTIARQRLAAGQGELDLGPGFGGQARGGALQITSSRMEHLLDALGRAYDVLGFGRASGGDEMSRQLVLARIIEPASRLGSLRVLEEAGVTPTSYATLKRRLSAYARAAWRQKLSAACAAHAREIPFPAEQHMVRINGQRLRVRLVKDLTGQLSAKQADRQLPDQPPGVSILPDERGQSAAYCWRAIVSTTGTRAVLEVTSSITKATFPLIAITPWSAES